MFTVCAGLNSCYLRLWEGYGGVAVHAELCFTHTMVM